MLTGWFRWFRWKRGKEDWWGRSAPLTRQRRNALRVLEKSLGHTFGSIELLNVALTHRSYANENAHLGCADNERLEFLGDAVLQLCTSNLLMRLFPGDAEGHLSKRRTSIVNERPLAELARQVSLGSFLLLGKGEENSGGREKSSILSDTFEAVIAAIYLDGGYPAANRFIERFFVPLIREEGRDLIYRDYKSDLQELAQGRFRFIPRYELVGEFGPDHDKTFEMEVTVADVVSIRALGKNKKEAEQEAARRALDLLALQEGGSVP